MRLSCPACQAEMSLELLLGREADARAVAQFIERHVAMGALLVQYIALFRPAKRRLQMARMVALLGELMPDIERGAITRKGREWAAPPAVWRAALEQVLSNRDKGLITLPLAGHGYLYEVISGTADKAEAVAERDGEAQRRARAHVAGAAPLAATLTAALAAPTTAPVAPPAAPARPTLLQREIKAAMAAKAAGRSGAAEPGDEA